MNILLDALSTSLVVEGKAYPIRADFKTGLRIILAMEDPELTAEEKQMVLLQNLFEEEIPPNVEKAWAEAVNFLNAGATYNTSDSPRVFSFQKDDRYIFAAFQQTHHIDLSSTVDLHWHVFLALFMDLGQDTTFCQVAALRRRLATGKASKWEKEAAQDMKEILALEDMEPPDAREEEILRQFEQYLMEGEKRGR